MTDTLAISLAILVLLNLVISGWLLRKVHHIGVKLWSLPENLPDHFSNLFAQLEARYSLSQLLALPQPLGATRGWAASPDLLMHLAHQVLDNQPQRIVECGSGVSTVVIARCLSLNRSGHVFSLESDVRHAEATRRRLVAQQLTAYATVIDAPLKEFHLRHESWPWYSNLQALPDVGIDMLFIDCPPAPTRSIARYPAVPLLLDRLAQRAVLFLDDASRPHEREAVQMWKEEIPNLTVEDLGCEKGLVKLTFP